MSEASIRVTLPQWAQAVAECVRAYGLDPEFAWEPDASPIGGVAYVANGDEADERSFLERALRAARVPHDYTICDTALGGHYLRGVVRFDERGEISALEQTFLEMEMLLCRLAEARETESAEAFAAQAAAVADEVALLTRREVGKDAKAKLASEVARHCMPAVIAEIERCARTGDEMDFDGPWAKTLEEGVASVVRRRDLSVSAGRDGGEDSVPGFGL